jgi:hypothetical protein
MDAEEPQERRESPTEKSQGAAREEIKEIARTRDEATELSALPPGALRTKDRLLDIELKEAYAYALLIGLGVQILIADAVFVAYAWKGVHWAVTASVMDVWLGATVVEVIGVVYVVTRSLFPRRDIQL